MERLHYIYRITNLVNNKVYIGQSINPTKRWAGHKREMKKPTQMIHHAFNKYGIDNFKFEVIATCFDQDAANDAETTIVFQESSLIPNGYNVTNGGYNSPKTEAWKQTMKEHWANPESKFRQLDFTGDKNPFYGKQHSEKAIELNRVAHKDKPLSENQKEKISESCKTAMIGNTNGAGNKGRKFSEETRKKMSDAKKGNKNKTSKNGKIL